MVQHKTNPTASYLFEESTIATRHDDDATSLAEWMSYWCTTSSHHVGDVVTVHTAKRTTNWGNIATRVSCSVQLETLHTASRC